jgi:hypothetical protein
MWISLDSVNHFNHSVYSWHRLRNKILMKYWFALFVISEESIDEAKFVVCQFSQRCFKDYWIIICFVEYYDLEYFVMLDYMLLLTMSKSWQSWL